MIKKIHHVGLAVESIDEVVAFFNKLFGAELHPGYQLDAPDFYSRLLTIDGKVVFELLEPRGSEGLIERFIKNRGQGIHHVSLQVSNREEILRQCDELGLNVIQGNFIHPRSAFGTLIELEEGIKGVDD